MSGLEPFAALGLACNILQLVEVGRKTIDCIKTVYLEGKLDKDLEQNAVVLEKLTNEVKKDSRPGNKKYEAILLQSAASCSTAARDLQEELRFIFGNAKRGSIASAVKVTATVKWRQRRLERLGRNLDTEETRLQTSLLAQVWSNTNAAHLDTRGVRRELRFFIEQYRQGRRETTDLVLSEGLKTRELVSHEAKRTSEAIALVDEKLNHLVVQQGVRMNDHVRERFLKSLKYPGFNQRRNQIEIAHSDTLKWIFVGDDENESGEDHDSRSMSDTVSESDGESECSTESYSVVSDLEEENKDREVFSKIKWDSFSNWLRSTDTIYWISGKPGSGKTTLVKYILDHPRTRMYLDFWSHGCEIASHYFWRPGSRMQKNLEGLFCSLLYQILSNNGTALGEVTSVISGPKDSFTDWSSTELRSALSEALASCKKGVCLFLDGVDEIDPEDGTKDGIPEFLELVSGLSQTGKIKLCLASRPEPHILEIKLSMYPRLRLQDLNYADLMAYTKERVKCPQITISEEYQDLVHSLVDKAEGVFLWLLLAIKSINEGLSYHDSAETLMERMNCLPKGLDSLYEDMWRRAGANSPAEYRKTAALYFKLVIATKQRISSNGPSRPFDPYPFLHNGVNIFDLMLATTPISGRVLDALNEPSKLICESILQQKCKEVEKKLKICCMGLIEVRTETDEHGGAYLARRDGVSWYGLRYEGIRPVAIRPSLQFIHRTARDFLTDTDSGRKILGCDTSSDYTIQLQLMEALLAKLAIFGIPGAVNSWAHQLRQIRQYWQGTEEMVLKDWDRLILICEKLANSGRLFEGDFESARSCDGINFLRAVASFVIDDDFIISRLKSGNLTKKEKSAILLSLSESVNNGRRYIQSGEELESRPRTFREFLQAGADPNWQMFEKSLDVDIRVPFDFGTHQSPWQKYLLSLMEGFTRDFADHVKTPPKLAAVVEILVMFVSEGAELDDMVNVWLNRRRGPERPWYAFSVESQGIERTAVFASIPAYFIVETLADSIPLYSQSNNESCLESCVVLKQACANHRSNKLCRVIVKMEYKGDLNFYDYEDYVLWEATNEMQTRLGSSLLESLKWQLLLMNCSQQQVMCESILNDEEWVVTAHGKAFWKRLEELELLELLTKSPGVGRASCEYNMQEQESWVAFGIGL